MTVRCMLYACEKCGAATVLPHGEDAPKKPERFLPPCAAVSKNSWPCHGVRRLLGCIVVWPVREE